MKLYPFQKQCVNNLHKGFLTQRVQCLAWYTGAGKTNVFVALCKDLVAANPQIRIGLSAYLTTEIRDQIKARLDDFGLKDVSHTIHGASWARDKNIYVFNPQSIYRKDLAMTFDYFIVDESHAGTAEDCLMIRSILKKTTTQDSKILLVSATPWDTLALPDFEGISVYKRPLDQGFADGLVTDFRFHAEEAKITFKPDDFSRQGDLGANATQRQMAVLKSACIGKMEYLLKSYDKELGRKCLVICPPGNYAEIARELAQRFGGRAFIQLESGKSKLLDIGFEDTSENLDKFKSDDSRFLFVVHKCQVGFDMAELNSVIDFTMSRNIKTLAQRCGRVARRNGSQEKHYFYVYDTSLMKDQLEWLLSTMVDFCLGAYDGWTTKTAKYSKRRSGGQQWVRRNPISVTLTEVISALKEHTENVRTLSYVSASGPPTKWTLERAKAEASKWSSRTEMWSKQPALYKWFRLNAKDEMNALFPLKHHLDKWHEMSVLEALRQSTSREEFKNKFPGAHNWMHQHLDAATREKLKNEHLGKSKSARTWNETEALALLERLRTWSHIRTYSGARRWMHYNGGEKHWQLKWEAMHRRKFRGSSEIPNP